MKINRLLFDELDFDQFGDNTLNFYKKALSKFKVFDLEFLKDDFFVFLDSDLLILGDISELFEVEEDFAACIDMGTPTEFNTGVMHIKKKWFGKDVFDKLMESAKANFSYRGDQEHINRLIGSNLRLLPLEYNTLKDKNRFAGSWLSKVKILHYISKKPWTPYDPRHHKAGNLECLAIENLWHKYFDELDFYKDTTLYLKSRNHIIDYVNDKFPNGVGVEVGVQRGEFSKEILKRWPKCDMLYLVDPWKEYDAYSNDMGAVTQDAHNENYEITKKNTEPWKDQVEFIRDFSALASDEFYDDALDFVYLDGRHDEQGIREDIEAWWPKVKMAASWQATTTSMMIMSII